MEYQQIQQIAQQLTTFLSPFLPYLLKAGEEAAKEAGKKFGAAVWDKAKALWDKLRRKEKVQTAAEAAAKLPDNPAIQQGLVDEITRALKEDPALLGETTRIVSELQVETVMEDGEVTGVWVTTPQGRVFIESKVRTGDVHGKVTGVRYEG